MQFVVNWGAWHGLLQNPHARYDAVSLDAIGLSKSLDIVWHRASVRRSDRERLNGHRSILIWFTGLSGSGKSTLAHAVEAALHELGCHTFVFDGDNVRHGLCGDLGFSPRDREENIRRIGEMTKLFLEAGVIALTAFISPFARDRRRVRELVGDANFIEVYCRCPIEVCEQRDTKGIYRRARQGKIMKFTGISSPYEAPENPELTLSTGEAPLEACVEQVIACLRRRGVIPPDKKMP